MHPLTDAAHASLAAIPPLATSRARRPVEIRGVTEDSARARANHSTRARRGGGAADAAASSVAGTRRA